MADLPVTPLANYGALLSSYGTAQANNTATTMNAGTNRMNALTEKANVASSIQQRDAGIALTAQQTQGKDLENQSSALQLKLLKNALQNYAESSDAAAAGHSTAGAVDDADMTAAGPTTAPSGNDAAGGTPSTVQGAAPSPTGGASSAKGPAYADKYQTDEKSSAHIDQAVASQYKVNPSFTPQEQAGFQAAIPLAMTGKKDMLEAVQKQHDMRVQTQTANSQNLAQQNSDKNYAVATAPKDAAYDALKSVYPAGASNLAKIHGLDPNPEKWTAAEKTEMDEVSRKYATMVHNSLFQYTGDKLEDKNGSTLNARTGNRPIGDQAQGLTPSKWADLVKSGSDLVNVPDPNGGPDLKIAAWRAAGAPSLQSWVGQQAKAAGGSNPADQSGEAPGAAPPAKTTSSSGTAQAKASGQAPADNTGLTNDPTMRKALADPEYKVAPQKPAVAGAYQGMGKQDEVTLKARTDLLKDAQDATAAAATATQYMTAAKAILDSKQAPTTGPLAHLYAQASAILPGQHVDATNYQEVAKYLGNAAVQLGKQNFEHRATESEVGMQMNELSPSIKMTDEAVRNLLDTNIKSAKYTIDSAGRVNTYLANKGDPQKFAKWQESYFPRAKVINEDVSPNPKDPKAPVKFEKDTPENRRAYERLDDGAMYIAPDGSQKVKGTRAPPATIAGLSTTPLGQ